MRDKYAIRIGYACINTELSKFNVFTSRSLILRTAGEKGLDYIKELVEKNIDDLFKIIIYNEAHGIRFFRISSGIFPHIGNPKLVGSDYDITFVKTKLQQIGAYAKKNGHRLTMHPGQYVQLGSPHKKVVIQSMTDLINHVNLLRYMKYKPSDGSVLIIHGGGTYGDKESALNRWKKNFEKMPKSVRKYISLENDENSYGIMDLLPLCEELSIPFCLDIFHNKISKEPVKLTLKLMKRIFDTWTVKNMNPKIHISDQQIGKKRGAHSKTLNNIPSFILELPNKLKIPLDIMLEVKDKEISVFKMYYKYFDADIDEAGKVNFNLSKKK